MINLQNEIHNSNNIIISNTNLITWYSEISNGDRSSF